jgi:hypothetical protein
MNKEKFFYLYSSSYIPESGGVGANTLLLEVDGSSGLVFDAASGALSNARSSTATYVDNSDSLLKTASVNVSRVDRGFLLHEAAETNKVLRSDDVLNVYWGSASLTKAASTFSTDGTNLATKLTANVGNAFHGAFKQMSSASTEQTNIVAAKAGTVNWLGLGFDTDAKTDGAFFNLSNGTIGTVSAGCTAKILGAVNGFYVCSVSRTYSSANHWISLEVHSADNEGSWLAIGTENIHVINADVFFNLKPSSHITTVAAEVTRAIDSISMPLSAAVNFVQSGGICFYKVKPRIASSATAKSLLCTNTTTDYLSDNGSGGIALKDGVNTATAAVSGWAGGDTLLIAAVWSGSSMSVHCSKNSGAWVDSSDTTYDGAFPAGANFLFFNANTDAYQLLALKIFSTTKSFAEAQTWAKDNAASET